MPPDEVIEKFQNSTFFDLLDYLTSNVMLPLGGLLIAVFAGWLMERKATMEELDIHDHMHIGYRLWRVMVRYVAPVAVAIVFLKVTGILDFITNIFSK